MSLVIRKFKPVDAPNVARMLNESEEGWPGGLTGGVPYTEDRVLDWIRSVRSFAPLVAFLDNRAVGICTVVEHYEDDEASYIEFLNVHPDYRGRGIGRSLLLRAIGESIKLGYKRVDLHTWSGNINAVPLYKKTGFYWVPKTSVYMQNYIPAILTHPLTRRFVRVHGLSHPSWYGRLVRKLDLKDDDYRYEGIKAFPYRFRADSEELIVIVDREARDIAGVETPRVKAGMMIEEQDAPAGFPQHVTWIIRNKNDKPLKVTIEAVEAEDAEIGPISPKSATVNPGEEATFKAVIKPVVEAKYRDEQEKAWRVKSTLNISGLRVPLCIGIRIKQPVAVSISPHPFTLWSGGEGYLNVDLKSEIRDSCRVRVDISHPTGIALDRTSAEISMTPIEHSGFRVKVKPEGPGLYMLKLIPHVEARGLKVRCKPITYNVRVHSHSTVLYGYEGIRNQLVAGNESIIVEVPTIRGSNVRILDGKTLTYSVLGIAEGLGPPYWPSEFERKKFKVEVQESKEGLTIRLESDSKKQAGIRMVKEILIPRGSHLVRLRYGFKNTSTREAEFKVKVRCWLNCFGKYYTIPSEKGLVRTLFTEGDFPFWEGDLPKKPGEYREGWIAVEDKEKGLVSAVLWRSPEEVDIGGGRAAFVYPVRVKPNSEYWTEPLYYYVGPGSWVNISRIWRRMFKGKPAEYEDTPPSYDEPVRLKLSPLIIGGQGKINLTLENLRLRRQSGTVRLKPPEGWSIEPTLVKVENLNIENPLRRSLEVKPHCRSGAYRLTAELELEGILQVKSIPLIHVGGGSKVEISEEKYKEARVFRVGNGYLEYLVGKELGAPLFSLKAGGDELLNSSFPKPRPYSWFGNWLGGICMFGTEQTRWRWSLQREKWTVKKIEGEKWAGIAAECTPEREEHDRIWGLKLRVEYLTMQMARFLLIKFSAENTTNAYRHVTPVIGFFLRLKRPGGEYRFILPGEREIVRREGRYMAWAQAERNYIIAYNTSGWPYITLVSREGAAKVIMGDESQEYGGNLLATAYLHLKPKTRRTYTLLFAVSESLEEARNYSLLSNQPEDTWAPT